MLVESHLGKYKLWLWEGEFSPLKYLLLHYDQQNIC